MVRYEAWRSRTFARRDLFGVLAAIDEAALPAPEARHLSLWRSSQRINGAHLDDAGRSAARAADRARVRAGGRRCRRRSPTTSRYLEVSPPIARRAAPPR